MKTLSTLNKSVLLFVAALSPHSVSAVVAPVALGNVGGFFSGIEAWMIKLMAFLTGPFGIFISLVALAMASAVWAIGSRSEEGLGKLGRVVIASLLLLNLPVLLNALKLSAGA